MERHVTAVGAVFIAFGILGILVGLVAFWIIAGTGVISGDREGMAILTLVGTIVGGLLIVLSIPEIIAGYGLLKHKEWARILSLILAVLSLIEIPIGTIVGIYALWVLLQRETIQLFNKPAP